MARSSVFSVPIKPILKCPLVHSVKFQYDDHWKDKEPWVCDWGVSAGSVEELKKKLFDDFRISLSDIEWNCIASLEQEAAHE